MRRPRRGPLVLLPWKSRTLRAVLNSSLMEQPVKVVTKTDEYTIFQRRDSRYAVKDANRQWVNGAAKVAILLDNKLIDAPPPPAPEPEPEAAAETDTAAAEADEATDEPEK